MGETLYACLTSAHANEKILGLGSVSVAVFLGRLAGHLTWYIMHNVCLNVLYEVFCVYLFLEIWHCLLGFYSRGLERQPSSQKKKKKNHQKAETQTASQHISFGNSIPPPIPLLFN